MSRKLSIVYFVHSLRSDWNNGNAHFLRGLLNSLVELGHEVLVLEPEDAWSVQNLRTEAGGIASITQFAETYPRLVIKTYASDDVSSNSTWIKLLQDVDVVIVHEWNPPEIALSLLEVRSQLRFRMIFHDTHHRASSSPDQLRLFSIERFDGVLAFGEALRSIYRERFGIERVWTLHEAADTNVFMPIAAARIRDVVWIGNWGDDERSDEIKRFLLEPARQLRHLRVTIYGVRYPHDGLCALRGAGVEYGGYLPNLNAPGAYAASGLTVHIPRQHYVQALAGIPTIRMFEAMACGVPLISAPWLDSEELFREGDYRKAEDSDAMREAIRELLDDPELAQAQALRGLETVRTRHTCAHRARELTAILEEAFF